MFTQLVAALAQRLHGALHGGIAQTPGDRHTLAEADNARKAVNNPKAVIVRTGYQQATIIGAKIECRIKGPAVLASRTAGGRCPLVRMGCGPIGPCPPQLVRTSRSTECRFVRRQRYGCGPIGIGHMSLLMCAVAGPGFGR